MRSFRFVCAALLVLLLMGGTTGASNNNKYSNAYNEANNNSNNNNNNNNNPNDAIKSNNNDNNVQNPMHFLEDYSVRFERCEEGMVTFRLCEHHLCETCDEDSSSGEYMVDLQDYSKFMGRMVLGHNMAKCSACDECNNNNNNNSNSYQYQNNNGNNNDNNKYNANQQQEHVVIAYPEHMDPFAVDCDNCYDECTRSEGLEDNGYIDAQVFMQCALIYDGEDGDEVLYAAGMCAEDGKRVKIGVFKDEDCNELVPDANVDDYLLDDNGYHLKLAYIFLKEQDDNNGSIDSDERDCVATCRNVLEDGPSGVCEHLFLVGSGCDSGDGVCIADHKPAAVGSSKTAAIKKKTSEQQPSTSTSARREQAVVLAILAGCVVLLAVYAAKLKSKMRAGPSSSGGHGGGDGIQYTRTEVVDDYNEADAVGGNGAQSSSIELS